MNIQCAYEVRMSPVLSGSSVLEYVKIGDVFEIRDGINIQFLIQDCHIHVLKYSLLYVVLLNNQIVAVASTCKSSGTCICENVAHTKHAPDEHR